MNALVRLAEPHVLIREGLNGAPVWDRQRIQWEHRGEVVAYEAGFAIRLRREAVAFIAVVCLSGGFSIAVILAGIAQARGVL